MAGSLDQLVLINAGHSVGGEYSNDDYFVNRRGYNVTVGFIKLDPQAPKDQPWFWTIVAPDIRPSVHNRGYSATREQPMADFKARWLAVN
jgi:hypothetical protein